jgi:hypothetical protein
MAWVPAENALFIASSIDTTKCPGQSNGKIHLRKVTLSVDGKRVVAVLLQRGGGEPQRRRGQQRASLS